MPRDRGMTDAEVERLRRSLPIVQVHLVQADADGNLAYAAYALRNGDEVWLWRRDDGLWEFRVTG